ncbi:uncharacterized protein LOC144577062 isoform X2 [Callithrix jacchus]
MPGGLPPRSSLWPSSPTPVTLCTPTVTGEASGSCCHPCPCSFFRWPELEEQCLAVLPPPLLHPRRRRVPSYILAASASPPTSSPSGSEGVDRCARRARCPHAAPSARIAVHPAPRNSHARRADVEAAAMVGGLRRAQRLRRLRGLASLHDCHLDHMGPNLL